MKKTERDKKKGHKELTPEHADWLVEHRARTQRTSAKLFRLLKEHSHELDQFAFGTQTLVAISFSLWRSAFLSDKTGFKEDTNDGAVNFLGEMLQNNAIAYSQERGAKDWTFNYYAGNAKYRLEDLAQTWPKWRMGELAPPKGEQTPKNRWEFLQKAFEKAVDHFEIRLNAAQKAERA